MVQHSPRLDAAFAALSDGTRRGILQRLRKSDATISELAGQFGMTLTGVKKHVGILEEAGLVKTRKVGRERFCALGPATLEREAAWIADYRRSVEDRLDRLGAFLERTRRDS